MKFDYYYGSQVEQFSFIRIPRVMLTDEAFALLSLQAKVLFSVFLDRMSISMKNRWFDEKNRVFIIYQISEIQDAFMLKYKCEIENLNYYAWAKFLEKINSDNVLVRVIDKLELATPKRNNLTVYREILRKEF